MENIEQFLEKHADASGNVSDADMAKLLAGGHQGDTAAGQPAESGVPAAGSNVDEAAAPAAGTTASQPEKATDPQPGDASTDAPAADVKTVILAKDGVHTIGYEKLVEARDAERAAKAEAEELRVKVADLMAKATAPAAAAPAAPADPADPAASIFGDFSEAAIRKGIETLTAEAAGKSKSEMAAELEPLKQHMATQAADAHFRTIYEKHPDMESIVESTEFTRWVDAQPSFVRDAYKAVLERGTAPQVVEMLDSYRAVQPAKQPGAAPAVDVSKRVEEAIANAKTKVPASLSDIPAGSAAHHDEVGAMAEMTTVDLMNKFNGMTPKQIEDSVRRLV